jgi:hypothetical protein
LLRSRICFSFCHQTSESVIFEGHATPAQLGAEWVQFENNGQYNVDLTGVGLYHYAYDRNGNPEWE